MRSRSLQDFIALRPDARSCKESVGSQAGLSRHLIDEIQTILDVSRGSITGWKLAYEQNGIDGLRLNHKGRKSYLSVEQRAIRFELATNTHIVGSLANSNIRRAFEYDVVYESKQSYYDLFAEAPNQLEKNHKAQSQSRPGCCCRKKKEIETILANHR